MIEVHDHSTDHGVVRELRLARPPANALTAELLRELHRHLTEPGAETRALVLAGRAGMFTGGLDVPELLRQDRAGVAAAFGALLDVCHSLASSPLPVAAAVTGHSPAGGAVLALFCDYRVMAEGAFRIGLNEVWVGIPLPSMLYQALGRLVGRGTAARMITTGELLDAAAARAAGLVDELAPTDDVVERAVAWCHELMRLPADAVAATRAACRQDLVDLFADTPALRDHFADAWLEPGTQEALKALVARLAKRPQGG